MVAQARPLAPPAADADVDVVALREDPAVAAGDDAELGDEPARVPLRRRVVEGEVPLERDAVADLLPEPERPSGRPVRAVGPDQDAGSDRRPVDAERDAVRTRLDPLHPDAVAEVGARCGGALRQVEVEPATLRHQAERRAEAALVARAVAEPQLEAVDGVLDDGADVGREEPDRAERQPAAARLVAREASPVDEEHRGARRRQPVRRGRPAGAGADDHGIEVLRHRGTACGAVVRTRRLCRRIRLNRPVERLEIIRAAREVRLQLPLPGVCPSGQRERAVNPSAQPTEVRILPPPLSASFRKLPTASR